MTISRKISLLLSLAFVAVVFFSCSSEKNEARESISLNNSWKTIANDSMSMDYNGFEVPDFDDSNWEQVDVPHNWDKYEGYLRKVHGNKHGCAWYRKEFTLDTVLKNKRYFLFFEGVGSYATVWVNGKLAGKHAGGRTTFTIDVTDLIKQDKQNLLAVRADHPAAIRNLPWVCGGCSTEGGFSEGSQPMGIFRPVQLIITNEVRVEPFGVHVWNDTNILEGKAQLNVSVELKNYSSEAKNVQVVNLLKNHKGKTIAESKVELNITPKEIFELKTPQLIVINPRLWSIDNPYLYNLHTQIVKDGAIVDELITVYGIRTISWPTYRNDSSNQFLLNGKAVFINGVGEYEHMFGNSHAFTPEQISARVEQVKAAGFNSFRDAHQPHNLQYQNTFDKDGILWWTQMSAHIWFDNPEFKANFKTLLREWVKERRNNPSNIIWGLQNESTLPTEFAEECVSIIRKMDPTSPSQRIVTTCNGGTGTDWNVIQNWSGTYGGNPMNYGNEISEQILNGEYGAWRSLDLHSEGPYNKNGILSEDRMAQLLEIKVRLADSVKDKCCGQYLWILSSHDNPGRVQSGEALRDIDRLGPINYKGLLTPWAEPLDAFYMYRANYVSPDKNPMVYIVSHTWPNRWAKPGIKDSITVYSNCDEVELFNDLDGCSLGKLKNRGLGKPFIWEKSDIQYNILHAKAYMHGKVVAQDKIVLNHLPEAPGLRSLKSTDTEIIKQKPSANYIYRVNCGGNTFIDHENNQWLADRHQSSPDTWGSLSWTDKFVDLPNFYGSQRRSFDPIHGTTDWKLFQTFRFGLNDLSYNFPVANGDYTVELYFTEPWYATGGGMNAKNWRLFDIAINGDTVLRNFDVWSEAGHDVALKKEYKVKVSNGNIKVHFPRVLSGQALISAIAISTSNSESKPVAPSPLLIQSLNSSSLPKASVETWLDWGDKLYHDSDVCIKELPSSLFGATWIKTAVEPINNISFSIGEISDIFIAFDDRIQELPSWAAGFISTDSYLITDSKANNKYKVYGKRAAADTKLTFGENAHSSTASFNMYSVFALPASTLDAPTDQRPVKNYSSENAHIKGNAVKKVIDGRHFIQFNTNETIEVEWDFYVGLASTYGLHFKFQNNTGGAVKAEMLVETNKGIEMHKNTIEMYYKPNNWRTVKTSTGTTINAGDYKVKLKIKNAKGLLLQRLEVQ